MKSIDRLVDRICDLKAPVVVGIDPVLDRIPQVYLEGASGDYTGASSAIASFSHDIIDAVYDVVPAVKPQMAFFEMYGSAGVAALEETVAYAHERGLVVIEDAKRNDIGSTARAYANGHLGKVSVPGGSAKTPYDVDFLTVSPYEGAEGLEPFIDIAHEEGRGIFILVKTSNPGSMVIQGALAMGEVKVCDIIAQYIDDVARKTEGESGYSSIGAVVGATYPAEALRLRSLMPRSFFLVPGYGAQGAGAKEVVPCFNDDGLGAIVNASRSIIYAYEKALPRTCTAGEYRDATRQAACAMRDDIYGALQESCPSLAY